jgi:hypothetical protein
MEHETENQTAHEAVLTLLLSNILTSEQANKLHKKIDETIKTTKRLL